MAGIHFSIYILIDGLVRYLWEFAFFCTKCPFYFLFWLTQSIESINTFYYILTDIELKINCDFDISHDIQAFWNSFVISFFKNTFLLYMISKILLIILIRPDVRNLVQIFYLIKFVHTFVHYFVLYSFEEFQGTEASSSFAYQFRRCENFKKSAPL